MAKVAPITETPGFIEVSPSIVQQVPEQVVGEVKTPVVEEPTPAPPVQPETPPTVSNAGPVDQMTVGSISPTSGTEAASNLGGPTPAYDNPFASFAEAFSSVLSSLIPEADTPAPTPQTPAPVVQQPNTAAMELRGTLDAFDSTLTRIITGDRTTTSAPTTSAPTAAPTPPATPAQQKTPTGSWKPERVRFAERAEGVNPHLLEVISLAEKYLPPNFELQVGHQGGRRSQEEQDKLVKAGYSKTRRSYHLTGNALDLQPIVDGVNRYDSHDMAYWGPIRDAMKRASKELGIPVEWGGDWKGSWDKPHWQLPKGWSPAVS